MMQNLFHCDATDYRWEMFDPLLDGAMGYAWSLSSFTSSDRANREMAVALRGSDFREGVASFMEKRLSGFTRK
jgi:hypothetical protein